ncbi:MAG: hypothetical protein KKE50_04770 [Nanoarchaeota archaeon]|nr:hypothetical protein [Nanoarchaeota archaeon]
MNKKQAEEKINEFFEKKHDKEEVRKIKKVAMKYRIKLKDSRKKFCSKCFSMNLKFRKVKSNIKTVECSECGNLMRWKLK